MSRIGNTPIEIPKDVTLTIEKSRVVIKGPKGELNVSTPVSIKATQEGNILTVQNKKSDKKSRALHGYLRAELANAITGVTKGWTKTLELSGVGYRAVVDGQNLVLTVGFSHAVTIAPPPRIHFTVTEGKIIVSGENKQVVGQIASTIRDVRKPEPYKGKGIKYAGEYIRKKAGKAKAIVGAAGGTK